MTGKSVSEKFQANLASWNERVPIHMRDASGIYNLDAFLGGADTLMPIERAELGCIVGQNIAHLQCHFGLDTLSLVRRGATVTGLDFSSNAIDTARELAARVGQSDTKFVCANVYDAPELLPRASFDRVYVTWGAIFWLPDIFRWAGVVSVLLKPGGSLYLADCHPVMAQLEVEKGNLTFAYPWREDEGLPEDESQTYAGDGTPLVNTTTYEWIHPVSDIVNGLIQSGLQLEFLHEHDTLPWQAVPTMIPTDDGMFRLPVGVLGPPVAFSLQARRH